MAMVSLCEDTVAGIVREELTSHLGVTRSLAEGLLMRIEAGEALPDFEKEDYENLIRAEAALVEVLRIYGRRL
jgi:hypothetical protein